MIFDAKARLTLSRPYFTQSCAGGWMNRVEKEPADVMDKMFQRMLWNDLR